MVGRTVGNYRLVEKLGEGGMGAVYKGLDLMVERDVAIKMLRPEIARQPQIVERFRAEAVALAKLNHPNIATLYSFFRQGDEYFMVMEYVPGRTLDSLIRNSPPMAIEPAITTSLQVLDAVEHAHSYGILHRDLKPANIMLTGSGQVKVTDFGIARVLGKARMTQEGYVCGTLEYLAPERIRSQEGDLRSDLYSIGVVLYEMLSGHLPFERDSAFDLMRAHLEEAPPSFASLGLFIPLELEGIVAKALAKLPEERFGTTGEFRSSLLGAVKQAPPMPTWLPAEPSRMVESSDLAVGVPAAVRETATGAAPAPAGARLPWKRYAIAVLVLVLIGLIVALSWPRKQPAAEATKPAPPPVVAQPSGLAGQPQAGSEGNSAPVQSDKPAELQQPIASSPATPQTKKSTPGVDRRKAALEALGEAAAPPANKTEEKRDRRSSSLEALQK
jgi:serine/threonine-protein kinase